MPPQNYENEPRFNGAYSRNDLCKIKVCIKFWWVQINRYSLDNFVLKTSYNVTHIGSFRVEHIPKKIYKFIGNKIIMTNICRRQADNTKCMDTIVLNLMSLC